MTSAVFCSSAVRQSKTPMTATAAQPTNAFKPTDGEGNMPAPAHTCTVAASIIA